MPATQIPSQPSLVNRELAGTISGFSLVEIAVVLVIVSVLTSMVAIPLAAQIELRRVENTIRTIDAAKDAVMGHAMAYGRLPCPATATSNGQSSYCQSGTGTCVPTTIAPSHGRCTAINGLLPAATLGFNPIDDQGYAVDAWADGTAARRIRYAVSSFESPTGTFPLTAADGIRTATMDVVAAQKHILVCGTGLATAPSSNSCLAPTVTLTDRAGFVIYSLGKNGNLAPSNLSFDEQNNQNGDQVFTSANANGVFDDIVSWVALNTLFERMVRAGRLP